MNKIICYFFGHKVYLEDTGCVHIQCCKRCNWTGRVTYDPFATPEERERIKLLNQKYGVLGDVKAC